MDWLTNPEALIGLAVLTALEVVLGIDNIVFISILTGKLPPAEQPRARRIGLLAAMFMRLLLLLTLAWVIKLTTPLFTVLGQGISGRDILLIVGGLFLIAKSVLEIHDKLEGVEGHASAPVAPSFTSVIVQIMLLDIIFSLDSVITAVGMVQHLEVMAAAVIIAVGIMLVFAEAVSAFVERRPTVKMLALSFLLLIGLTLFVEGFHVHVPKGYIYFAMAFSVFVELLNLKLRPPADTPVRFHQAYTPDGAARDTAATND